MSDPNQELQGELTLAELGDALTTRLAKSLADALVSASKNELTSQQFTELSKGLIRVAFADYGVALMEIVKRKMLAN